MPQERDVECEMCDFLATVMTMSKRREGNDGDSINSKTYTLYTNINLDMLCGIMRSCNATYVAGEIRIEFKPS